jgi:iron complex outermembrane receptor protein
MRDLTVFVAAMLVVMPAAGLGETGAPASKQDTAKPIEEIVVTATRRARSLQEMGETASAFTDVDLSDRLIQDFADLNRADPSVNIATFNGETSVFIRGIGTPLIIAGNDSSVGTYLDGVFLSRGAAIEPAFFDVERVEILKGPQGTLYGRNATGGAVNILTKDPTDTLSMNGDVTLGNYDRARFSGAIAGPLSDRIGARLAVRVERRDGYTDGHRADGSTVDLEDRKDVAVRAKVRADLSDAISLGITGDYYEADDRAMVWHYGSAGYQDEVPGWLNTREGAQALAYFALKSTGRASEAKSRDLFVDAPYYNETKVWGVTGDVDWEIDGHELTLIANYRKTHPKMQNEFDLSDAFANVYQREEDHWQRSIEGLLSSPSQGRLQWIAGAYYFEEKNVVTNNAFGNFWEPILSAGLEQLVAAGVIPPIPTDVPESDLCCALRLNGQQETEAWAAYLDTTLDVTDVLTLKLGGRYSREQRDGAQLFDLVVLPASPGAGVTRFAPNALLFPNAISDSREGVVNDPFGFVVAPNNGPKTFSAFTPKIGIEYEMSENVLGYLNVQRGFKSGGYNIGSGQRDPFAPEKIWSYEAGVKSDLFDDLVRFNAAYFFYDYTNLQAQDAINNQPQVRNVGEAEVQGADVQAILRLTDSMRLEGTLTYLHTRFKEGELTEPSRPAPASAPPGSVVRDLSGLEFIRAPEWKYSLAAEYAGHLPWGDTLLRVDYTWQSKTYFTVFNIDAGAEGSYGLLSARARWTGRDSRWAVTVFGDNLTDETYFSNLIISGAYYGGEFIGPLGPPRTFGVELSYDY